MNVHTLRNSARILAATASVVFAIGGTAAFASDFSGSNDTTGPNSRNRNDYRVSSTTRVTTRLTGRATNTASAHVDTGNLHVNHNTTVGDAGTGNIDVNGAFHSDVNTGSSDLVSGASFDPGLVSADFSNDTTGPSSDNRNTLTVRNTRNVTETSNANISNNARLNLGTGNVHVNGNTTVGEVQTGDINGSVDFSSSANSSSSSVASATLSSSPDVWVDGSNHLTGPSSSNVNTVNVSDTSNVSVSKNATIANTICANADSGNVHVNGNTTVDGVHTGSVTVGFTTDNQAN